MLRIDFYVQHLVRHNALGIELASDAPVTFRFATGDRKSSKAIDHAQLVHLVEEAAPAGVLESVRRSQRAKFVHRSSAGLDVRVEVEPAHGDNWTVRLAPADGVEDEPVAATESIPLAEPARAEARVAGAALGFGVELEPPSRGAKGGLELELPSRGAAPKGGLELTGYEIAASAAEDIDYADRKRAISGGGDAPRIEHYLRKMKQLGASDLHMSSKVVPMVRLHGEMKPLEQRAPFTSDELRELLLEIMPDRNKAEFEERNDTDFAYTIEGLSRFRANVFVDRHGVGAVFRQIPFEILSAEKLGIPPKVLDLCWLSKGLVLVTGPTGSGKSTTLATLVDFINRNRADHIITIEDPVEFVHENKKCLVNQREVGTHTKSFKAALRAALREDPDIVLVGEMRDLETISIAIETAETGHLVFGTLHTTSAVSTVDRIIDQFPADQQAQIRVMLSESLRGVIAQVLCKKKGGGRVAAYEVLISNSAVANLIREGKTVQLRSVMQTGKTLGMQTMNDHLVELVRTGLVEPEEAYVKSNDKATMKAALAQLGHTIKLAGNE